MKQKRIVSDFVAENVPCCMSWFVQARFVVFIKPVNSIGLIKENILTGDVVRIEQNIG